MGPKFQSLEHDAAVAIQGCDKLEDQDSLGKGD